MKVFALAALALVASAAPKVKPTKSLKDAEIGNMVVMKIERDGAPLGTLKLGLFNKELPRTTRNFEELCQKHFVGSPFHRVIPQFMAQGGDFTKGNGTGGKSIYGEQFEDEAFIYKHDLPGALSMANRGPNTNGSQFFVTFTPTAWLDGGHVVYGCTLDGHEVLTQLEAYGSSSGKTNGTITVSSCSVSQAPENSKCMTPTSASEDL